MFTLRILTAILVGDELAGVQLVLLAQPELEVRGDSGAVALPDHVPFCQVPNQPACVELASDEAHRNERVHENVSGAGEGGK